MNRKLHLFILSLIGVFTLSTNALAVDCTKFDNDQMGCVMNKDFCTWTAAVVVDGSVSDISNGTCTANSRTAAAAYILDEVSDPYAKCDALTNAKQCTSAIKFYTPAMKRSNIDTEGVKLLYDVYEARYNECANKMKSKLKSEDNEILSVCAYPKCTWVTVDGTLSNGKCLSVLPNPLPQANFTRMDEGLINSTNTKKISVAELKTMFTDELERNDFYLRYYFSKYVDAKTKKFLKDDYEVTAVEKVPCDKVLLFPWIPELVANEQKGYDVKTDCTLPLIYVKSIKAPVTKTETDLEEEEDVVVEDDASEDYFLYVDTYLGFIPLHRNADDATYSSPYAVDPEKILSNRRCGKDKCKYSENFCNDIIKKDFKINKATIVAWAMTEQTDLLAKGTLTFTDGVLPAKKFPYSMDQLRALRTYCPVFNQNIAAWVMEEKDWLTSGMLLKEIVKQKAGSFAICKLIKDGKINEKADIPLAYKNKLKEMLGKDGALLEELRVGCDSNYINTETSFINKMMQKLSGGEIVRSLNAEETKVLFKRYLLMLNTLEKASAPSATVLKNLRSDYKQERKNLKAEKKAARLAKNGTCKAPKTWWKSFTCSLDGTAIAGIVAAGLQVANFIWQIEQWKEELALQKKIFEEGDCYPYKADHEAGIGIQIPFTMAGVTKSYDMYEFCRLTASGALAFMDTCGSLIANKAPQTAIDACYGIQARQKGAYAPVYSSASVSKDDPKTAANNNNTAEKKKDDAAGTSGAGAAAGAGSTPTTSSDKDKKSKSPYDSVYTTPYQYGGPANKTEGSRYPYGSYDQTTSNTATTSTNKPVRTLKDAPGSTIGDLVTGHKRTIEGNIVGGK